MCRVRVVGGILIVVALASYGHLSGWPWSRNMESQPSKGPLDTFYPVPDGTLARGGRLRVTDRMDAHEKLSNPVQTDSLSVTAGRRLFAIYCSPCHGVSGAGDGPVAEKFVPPPPLFPLVGSRSDGYLYGTVRFGGPIMPPYGEAFRDEEIWDIINFLRSENER